VTDSKLINAEKNDLWESDKLITINLPVIAVEVPEVEVFEIAISGAKVPEALEAKTNNSLKPKEQRQEVELTKKSEQFEQEEKRLIALIVLLLILLTIGSSF